MSFTSRVAADDEVPCHYMHPRAIGKSIYHSGGIVAKRSAPVSFVRQVITICGEGSRGVCGEVT
jgi:hypothetical protein